MYLESDSEGQVVDGVRVELLKLETEESRPIGEMSDSWKKEAITLNSGPAREDFKGGGKPG